MPPIGLSYWGHWYFWGASYALYSNDFGVVQKMFEEFQNDFPTESKS